jgi:hypothetical protein
LHHRCGDRLNAQANSLDRRPVALAVSRHSVNSDPYAGNLNGLTGVNFYALHQRFASTLT